MTEELRQQYRICDGPEEPTRLISNPDIVSDLQVSVTIVTVFRQSERGAWILVCSGNDQKQQRCRSA